MKGVKRSYLRKYTNILYLFKSEQLSLIKIGITCNVHNRLSKLNENIKNKAHHFQLVDFVQFEKESEASYYEKTMHSLFSEYQIATDIVGAKTECFDIRILDSVLDEIFNRRCHSFYDPFVFVDDEAAEEILGVSVSKYCEDNNITTSIKIKKIGKIFRNLAANVVVNNKTHLHYFLNFMSDLGVASGTTFTVFKDFIPPYSFVDFELKKEYTVKVVGMDLVRRCLNFRKHKAHHILKIYSLTKANLVAKRHIAYKKEVYRYFGLDLVMGNNDNCIVEVK